MTDILQTRHAAPNGAPDRAAALEQYRRRANVYDVELAAFEPIRRLAVGRLEALPGQTVLDVGCGTGLSFELLQQQVGAHGAIIGIEQSEHMLAHARERIAKHHWSNVTLLCAPVEAAEIESTADAALFHFTHDILRNVDALANISAHLRPGGHVVCSGLQWAQFWAWPVNLFVWPAALHSMTSLEGLDRPWSKLADLLEGFDLQTMLAGGVYVAHGTRPH